MRRGRALGLMPTFCRQQKISNPPRGLRPASAIEHEFLAAAHCIQEDPILGPNPTPRVAMVTEARPIDVRCKPLRQQPTATSTGLLSRKHELWSDVLDLTAARQTGVFEAWQHQTVSGRVDHITPAKLRPPKMHMGMIP
jgi:hypothetical protein